MVQQERERLAVGREESFGERDEPGVQPGPPGSVLDLGFVLVGRFLVHVFVVLVVVRLVFEFLVVGRLGFLIDLTIDVCHADLRPKPSK
jgi:hypothetical protein